MYSIICKYSYVCFIVLKLVSLIIASLRRQNMDLFRFIIFFHCKLSSEGYKRYYFIEGPLANKKLLMSVPDSSIVISSMNCRGLKNKQKKIDVLDYLKNTDSNIICLQDTHWISEDSRHIRSIWNNICYIHGSKTNARGVAILINK